MNQIAAQQNVLCDRIQKYKGLTNWFYWLFFSVLIFKLREFQIFIFLLFYVAFYFHRKKRNDIFFIFSQ